MNRSSTASHMEMREIWGLYTFFVSSRPVYRKEIKGSYSGGCNWHVLAVSL